MTEGARSLAAEIVAAINSRDPERLHPLVDEGSEVVTGRSTHRGPDAIAAWARKEYDHLVRRYSVDEFRSRGSRVLALGAVEYVWRDEGEVADSSPIALDIELSGDRLGRLTLHDDTAAALAGFAAH